MVGTISHTTMRMAKVIREENHEFLEIQKETHMT